MGSIGQRRLLYQLVEKHHPTFRALRAAAAEMAAEEREHVSLIQAWLDKVEPPEPDCDEDFDPPNAVD